MPLAFYYMTIIFTVIVLLVKLLATTITILYDLTIYIIIHSVLATVITLYLIRCELGVVILHTFCIHTS